MTTRLRLLLLAPVLLFAVLAGCGDDDDGDDAVGTQSTESTTTTAAGGESGGDDYGGTTGGSGDATKVVVQDFAFSSATVAPGAEVTVENKDQAPHTATADDDAFDSGSIAGGESGSFTAPSEPGEYAYHCEIHPDMTGTLTVEG
jgi:plastocyanin